MSINITDVDVDPNFSSVRMDGAPRSVSAKQRQRDTLLTEVEAFLSTGGVIQEVAVGVSSYHSAEA